VTTVFAISSRRKLSFGFTSTIAATSGIAVSVTVHEYAACNLSASSFLAVESSHVNSLLDHEKTTSHQVFTTLRSHHPL
jgi:hypothetical protein